MSIAVGEEYAGAVMGDISTRRGRIVGTDSNDAGETIIIVRVPYAEVVSYTNIFVPSRAAAAATSRD